MKFALRMAWRDFRAKPSRFLLYIGAIAIGVGSLTAIESFRRQLSTAIENQGRNLLGADLLLRSRRPFNEEQRALVEAWPGERAQLISYRTMLLEPGSGTTRLVEVHAFDDAYPFYGELTTQPPEAARRFKAEGSVLVDEVLLLQLELVSGDEIQLAGQTFRVAGAIRRTPGEVPARSLIAPRVFMPLRLAGAERFERPGMMARFEWYLANRGEDVSGDAYIARAQDLGLRVDTVAERREDLLGGADRMSKYLGLMGFTALMTGCLGVAGAVQFFVNAKRQAVAQLRCIGASLYHAAGLFAVQLLMLAFVGASLGVGVGLGLSQLIPKVLAPFIPVPVVEGFRIDAAWSAWVVGFLFTVLAGMLPITRLRLVSPLISLRVDAAGRERGLDLAGVLVVLALTGGLLVFAARQLSSVKMAALYLGGVAVVIGLLALTGLVLRAVCRRAIRPGWSYPLRLAVSALYRPQNQTALLLVSLGLGVFLLNTVDVLEQHLIDDVEVLDRDRPNIAMVDIQVDQRDALVEVLQRYEPSSVYIEPMITMRLAAINGTPVEQLEEQPEAKREDWALKREFRATYRSEMKPAIEKLLEGPWIPRVPPGTTPAPISLEQGIAKALQVGVGDAIAFDIHGEAIETRVANLREADWKSMQPNFFVIFPEGVIEEAPQSMLLFTEIKRLENRAAFQAAVARQFPNITAIDISVMMNAVSTMVGQLTAAVRTIAWMTLAAGFLVLMAILRAGRSVRLREAVLLRTIGAPESAIVRYQVIELVLLTMGAIASGLILSWVAAGLIVHYVMKLYYAPHWLSPAGYLVSLVVIVLLAGWLHARSATRRGPAETWRALSLSSS